MSENLPFCKNIVEAAGIMHRNEEAAGVVVGQLLGSMQHRWLATRQRDGEVRPAGKGPPNKGREMLQARGRLENLASPEREEQAGKTGCTDGSAN